VATRKQLWHPDEVRQKIQASQLINRLTNNALSDAEIMSAGQVRSAEILLRKAVPDLASVQIGGDANSPVKMEIVWAGRKKS
jgi:hypothetical protein